MIYLFIISLLIVLPFNGCGESSNQDPSQFSNTKTTGQNDGSDLTPFELENGIGPVKEKLQLGEIDPKLVAKGEEIFNQKCAACHKLDDRYVGPSQRDLLERRTPEYVMNMMLNPDEMLKRHPEAKKMLAQYMTPMPNQNLTYDDARALLDYFRKVVKETKTN
ncbi:MAG: hypothetical protein Kow0098_12450 [Ignavibacteriaceae bacterium]